MNKNIFSFIISVPVTRYWTKYFSCRFFNRLQFQLLGSGMGAGIQLAEEECQHQFRHRRWNCSIFSYQSRDTTLFTNFISRGESEMAFVAI